MSCVEEFKVYKIQIAVDKAIKDISTTINQPDNIKEWELGAKYALNTLKYYLNKELTNEENINSIKEEN